jgi:hypothetical protein
MSYGIDLRFSTTSTYKRLVDLAWLISLLSIIYIILTRNQHYLFAALQKDEMISVLRGDSDDALLAEPPPRVSYIQVDKIFVNIFQGFHTITVF